MSAAAFGAAALFVWTRSRLLLAVLGLGYVLLLIGSQMPGIGQSWQYWFLAVPVLIFAPVFAPLVCLGAGANADAASPDGLFPKRFFVLPVTVHQMVLPFMAYAALLAAVQWSLAGVIFHGRVLSPATTRVWLPFLATFPFLATSFVVWLQALMWTPARSRGVRWSQLLALLFVYIIALAESLMNPVARDFVIVLSIAVCPIAYAVALSGVAKARRGELSPVVRENDSGSIPVAPGQSGMREFRTPLEAQLWMERRLHRRAGTSAIVALTAAVLLFTALMAIPLMPQSHIPREALQALVQQATGALLCGLMLVGIVTGLNFSTFRSSLRSIDSPDAYPMPPYFAALPLTTGDFAWAKMRAATQRMLLLSAGVLLICAIVAQVSGLTDSWLAGHAQWRAEYGLRVTLALGVLPYVSGVMWMLSATASVMCVYLAGRRSVVFACGFAGAALLVLCSMLGHGAGAGLITEILPIVAVLKLLSVAALTVYVGSRRILKWSRLVAITSLWAATVGTLAAYFSWYLPAGPEGHDGWLSGLSLAILLAPVLGAVAAPVALTFNRVR